MCTDGAGGVAMTGNVGPQTPFIWKDFTHTPPALIMDENEILETIARYKFYHIIQLTNTITTPGWEPPVPAQNLCLKHLGSPDIKGKRVLDIGCRDGLFSFKAESMGADEVIGIDNDLSEAATQFLIPFFKSKVQMIQLNLYDLSSDILSSFDVVIFAEVLYHLRYPFWGLKVIRDVMKVGGHLLIETAIWHGEPDKAMLLSDRRSVRCRSHQLYRFQRKRPR
jgi:2-polyprenyl-3-methyl-5-hydroxy-6-metoxy-1,4-benzoquinol methylase